MPPFELSPNPNNQNGVPDVDSDGTRYLYTWVGSNGGPFEVFTNAFSATANEPDEQPVETAIELSAYPSPFANDLTVSFTLPQPVEVNVDVYDVLGRHVERLADGLMTSGQHSVGFRSSGLPNGTYLIRMVAGATVVTRTMVKID